MVQVSVLGELRQQLIAFAPEFYDDVSALPKMQSIVPSLNFPSLSHIDREWQQNDLYCLFHLPSEKLTFIRENLAVYERIQLENNTEITAKQYYLGMAQHFQNAVKSLSQQPLSKQADQKTAYRTQLHCLYLIFAAIKNFLLLQEIRIKVMPSGLGQENDVVLREANSIQEALVSSRLAMLDLAECAAQQLARLAHEQIGSKLYREVMLDFQRVEALIIPALLRRAIFSELGAMKLQAQFTQMQVSFSEAILRENSKLGMYYYVTLFPCFSPPLKEAYNKLQEMKLMILDDSEESMWAVLGYFLEARRDGEDYPEFSALMSDCFVQALGLPITACDTEIQNIALSHLAAYRQSKTAPSLSILREREMVKMGYRRM